MKEPTAQESFRQGLWTKNPVLVQLLGMCPVLAVSNSVANALAMGLATSFVLVASALMVSWIRHWVPPSVRIAVFILIIATFVSLAEMLIQAVSLEVHKALGPFISLIVVNCIILGQAESFASKHPPLPSVIDAFSRGSGFTLAILAMGAIRELLGKGSLLGYNVLGEHFLPWVVFLLPGGGFFVLGFLLMLYHRYQREAR
ncbi:MAG: electron transport complex subunit RsxE [bacterium]|nr:electron transport complex subunit RsxE [bacterium]